MHIPIYDSKKEKKKLFIKQFGMRTIKFNYYYLKFHIQVGL